MGLRNRSATAVAVQPMLPRPTSPGCSTPSRQKACVSRTPERQAAFEEAASPVWPKSASPGETHKKMQERLREVCREGPSVTIRSISCPRRAGSCCARLRFWHDSLEEWGFRTFPVITDHFNLAVYSLDLAVRSIRWFRFGAVAVFLGLRLFLYAIMLLPAFLRIMMMYYHDPRIKRRIRYGSAQREYLDIYLPVEALAAQKGEGPKVPVVVAVMGGAFIIGHRGYNAQLGLRLMDLGVIVVGVDYRNFPRGRLPDMVEDVGRGVRWVFQHIAEYGGDVDNVLLVGQSAGAHLASMLLLEHCLMEVKSEGNKDSWSVGSFKGFLGVSGPYDLVNLQPHLASRGLYPRILHHMTEGDLEGCSPCHVLASEDWRSVAEVAGAMLPQIYLLHGELDKAVPSWSSIEFADRLTEAGVQEVQLDMRAGMTHTYPVVEGPMARHEPQTEIILRMLLGEDAVQKYLSLPRAPPMWPQPILNAAGVVSPF